MRTSKTGWESYQLACSGTWLTKRESSTEAAADFGCYQKIACSKTVGVLRGLVASNLFELK